VHSAETDADADTDDGVFILYLFWLYNKRNINFDEEYDVSLFHLFIFSFSHFLEGNRLSRILLAPQLAAPPMTPPATARPRNAAPATTTGAILGLGAGDDENDGSIIGCIFDLECIVYYI
jgi:hypothetical protein